MRAKKSKDKATPVWQELKNLADAMPMVFHIRTTVKTGAEILHSNPEALDGIGQPINPKTAYKIQQVAPLDHFASLKKTYGKNQWAGVRAYQGATEQHFIFWQKFAKENPDWTADVRRMLSVAKMPTDTPLAFTRRAVEHLGGGHLLEPIAETLAVGTENPESTLAIGETLEDLEARAADMAAQLVAESMSLAAADHLAAVGRMDTEDFERVKQEIQGEITATGKTMAQVIERRQKARAPITKTKRQGPTANDN